MRHGVSWQKSANTLRGIVECGDEIERCLRSAKVATDATQRFGLEAAQVYLGHASADVTQVYAERNRTLAKRVASAIG
jgi:integrase